MGQGGCNMGKAQIAPKNRALRAPFPAVISAWRQRAPGGLATLGASMAAGQKGCQQAPKFEPLWERLQANIAWYDRKAKANQRAYKVSKISIIVLAILIPVFAEYGMIPGMYDTRAGGRGRRRDRPARRAPGAEQMAGELDPLSCDL